MAQPQAYNREIDFTERDGDDTNHTGINTELDAAALSINQLRTNIALIQKDDGGLQNGVVTAESLAPSAFDAVLVGVNEVVGEAQTAADQATLAANTAISARDAAVLARSAAETAQGAASLNAATATNEAADALASALAAESSALNAANAASAAVTQFATQFQDGVKQAFVAGTNYTKNVTTALTLSQTPRKAGSVHIYFDGVYQNASEYSLSGAIITFTAAIPADRVEVVYDVNATFLEDAIWRLSDARLRESFRKEKATTVAPSLLLDFSGDKTLDPRITFTRASTATYFDSNGVMRTAAANVARFDHNPATGESLGLLIEESRTNLFTFSSDFSNAAWSKTSLNLTPNIIAAPDGSITGSKISSSSGVFPSGLVSTGSLSIATSSISIYAKAAEATILQIATFTYGNFQCYFDLVNGTSVGPSGFTRTITPVGDGWYRCTVSGSLTIGGNFIFIPMSISSGLNPAPVGQGIYVWGAQLEAGAFPTSYIQTEASQVTRATDAASMTGANFTSWYRADEGTFYSEVQFDAVPTTSRRIADFNAGNTNRSVLEVNAQALQRFFVLAGGASQATLMANSPVSANATVKSAGSYASNNFNAVFNGVVATPDTSGVVPVVNALQIGAGNGSVFPICSSIKKLAYYPKRLPNSELQAMTA